ncbi:Rossmann-fold NAD(P)-binding domain-containing protein, partial [Singulisphaera rosea]
ARKTAHALQEATGRPFTAFGTSDPDALSKGLAGAAVIIAAGAAGAQLLSESTRRSLPELKVVIDLNAVPPLGIEGVNATDKGADRDGVRAWGALGVGGTKMKIHRKALAALFTSNDKILDAEEVLTLGQNPE